ncbi:PEP-CTERM sorting domain-containing protein [Akkermansiaceae bacterium]|nr:PEP-CTERM sorting domain-containing protein [Akkermansiaceae bacterium]
MKKSLISSALIALTIGGAQAATVQISGSTFVNFRDSGGNPLAVGSAVQIGYFSGVDPTTSGADFTPSDWNSFQAILGIDTSIASTGFRTQSFGAGFEAVFNDSVEIDTADLGLPDSYPVRLGFRFFDTTGDSTTGSNFNTVVRDDGNWLFNDPDGFAATPPSPGISGDTPDLFWQDSTNPFSTSISAIPEPSTSLSALLGLALLAGARRRK